MHRRDFLSGVCRPLLLGFAAWLAGCTGGVRRPIHSRALLDDLAKIRGRDYSEVGVCMLLTGDDLANPVTRRQDLGGSRLAAVLDEHVQTFSAARPEATEDDVAALVELIAARDFAAGAREF